MSDDNINPDNINPIDRATLAITRAAQNYVDAKTFTEALRMYTDVLDHRQLVNVIAQLAGLLSAFYDADPLSNKGQRMVEELNEWLNDESH